MRRLPAQARSGPLTAGTGYQGFAFEPKLDGFRCLIRTEGSFRAISRRRWDMTPLLPELARFPAPGVLDGELAVDSTEGRSEAGPAHGRKEGNAMGVRAEAKPLEVVERLHRAMNEHDLEAHLACFDPNYRSEQPAHPNRGFGGREQVEKNWAAIYGGISDFHAELVAAAAEGGTAWAEWHWTGTRTDGTRLDLRGVTLVGVEDDRIVWGRLYIEDVEEAGEDIDEAVRRMAGQRPQDR